MILLFYLSFFYLKGSEVNMIFGLIKVGERCARDLMNLNHDYWEQRCGSGQQLDSAEKRMRAWNARNASRIGSAPVLNRTSYASTNRMMRSASCRYFSSSSLSRANFWPKPCHCSPRPSTFSGNRWLRADCSKRLKLHVSRVATVRTRNVPAKPKKHTFWITVEGCCPYFDQTKNFFL